MRLSVKISRIDIIGQNGPTGDHYMSDGQTEYEREKREDCMKYTYNREQDEGLKYPTVEHYEDKVKRFVGGGAWNNQVGGGHYKGCTIQPMEFSMSNQLNALQHTILKYVCRYKDKNGKQDLEKAKHALDMLIEWEYPQ